MFFRQMKKCDVILVTFSRLSENKLTILVNMTYQEMGLQRPAIFSIR